MFESVFPILNRIPFVRGLGLTGLPVVALEFSAR